MADRWTAAEVKERLRRRHPATQLMGIRTVPGAWTCVEELLGCDLLAISAHARPKNGAGTARYPRVGYEVKVSRGDMRTELLNPSKRALAVAQTHAFYFATPKGLLKPEEIAYEEPAWAPGDFARESCPRRDCMRQQRAAMCQVPVPSTKASPWDPDTVDPYSSWTQVPCPTCDGKGYLRRSRVEEVAPTLWVPRDVGLVEVGRNGCRVVRPSPTRREPTPVGDALFAVAARHISSHPDPRHEGVVEADRALSRELRAGERRRG